MKSNKGLTLATLILTVVILSIITAVTINVGTTTYENAEVASYVATMNLIQARVNVVSQKIKDGDTEYSQIGTEISQLDEATQAKIILAMGNTSQEGFKYYNETALEELGLSKIEENVVINLETREIFSVVPVKYEDVLHYNQYDLPNGTQIIEYSEIETVAPQFTIEKHNYGLTTEVKVTNIIYDEQISGSDIYYGEVIDDTTTPVTVSHWMQAAGTSFAVTKTATYAVKVVDKNGGETIKTVDVVTCNAPELTTGMVPVIYENGNWKKVDTDEMGTWYDYAEGKWANIMLSDGLEIATDGTVTSMGSMFVWIPRYAYQITSNYHNGGEGISGNINVRFLKNLTYVTTEENTTVMANESGQDNWNVHPAFTDGSENNYANGGWDREIPGFWVAKFEASSSNPSATYGGGDVTNLNVKVLPNVTSWRGITLTNIYANCLNMNATGNIYGISSNAVTHLMKNSEWGAVAYLTQSGYGRAGTEVTINNSADYTTGNAGNTISETQNSGGVTNEYNTESGGLASTTGNIYGIYDMSGGAHEIVASSTIAAVDSSVITQSNKLYNIVTTSTSNTGEGNYALITEKYGDAIYEISEQAFDGTNETTNKKSWNEDYNSFVNADYPLSVRGGKMNSTKSAGIFAFQRNASCIHGGTGSEGLSFRPTIVIE